MFVIVLVSLSALFAGGMLYYKQDAQSWVEAARSYKAVAEERAGEIERLHSDSLKKIEDLKDDVVNRLAACETKGVKEPDAAIIFDSNNQASIGAWQYQIKTVQHFVKKFEQRDITRVEAIKIAIDHEKAHALTKRVLFEIQSGASDNWYNCEKKLGLEREIAVIKKLD